MATEGHVHRSKPHVKGDSITLPIGELKRFASSSLMPFGPVPPERLVTVTLVGSKKVGGNGKKK